MDKTNVVVGGNVQGDITSCKIENQLIKTEKASVWSIKEKNTYASYDVCSKKVISQYVVPEFTGTVIGYIFFVVILFFVFLIVVTAQNNY